MAALAYLVATLMATRDVLREVNQGLHRDLARNHRARLALRALLPERLASPGRVFG